MSKEQSENYAVENKMHLVQLKSQMMLWQLLQDLQRRRLKE